MFFFYAEDVNRAKMPGNLVQATMPTALERTGDFSQTVDLNGNRVSILDPLNNRVAFPGNVIPRNRVNQNGVNILNIFPLPNFFDTAISRRNYNYNFQETFAKPTRQESLRLDYNATDKLRIFFRGTTYKEGWEAYYIGGGQQWPFSRQNLLGSNPALTTAIHLRAYTQHRGRSHCRAFGFQGRDGTGRRERLLRAGPREGGDQPAADFPG